MSSLFWLRDGRVARARQRYSRTPNWESANAKTKREETGERKDPFLSLLFSRHRPLSPDHVLIFSRAFHLRVIPTIWEAETGYLSEVVAYERVVAHGRFDCNNQSENYTDVNQPQGIQDFRQVISGFPCQGKSFRPISIYEMVKSDLGESFWGILALMVVCHYIAKTLRLYTHTHIHILVISFW